MSAPVVTLEGNIVNEPELRFTPNGKAVCKFTLATSDAKKDEQTGTWANSNTAYWKVEVWNQQAENCAESLTQGMSVTVVGKATEETWENKDGTKGKAFKIIFAKVSVSLSRYIVKTTVPNPVVGSTARATDTADPWASPVGGGWGANESDVPPF